MGAVVLVGSPVIDLAGNEVKAGVRPYQQGMVFRCDLDGSNVETLGHNFRNNWELAVDSFGRMWQSDNDDDGNRGTRMSYVIPYGNYGYRDEMTGAGWRAARVGMSDSIPERHWHLNDPGVIPNLYQTGAGSPTGIAVYEGDTLPEAYRGQLLHCDAGPNAVRAYVLTPDGAGFTAEQKGLLTGENDRWFRPSDVTVAPDGTLVVADWYDPGVGGHLMEDVTRGRLFRLRPAGSGKAYEAPPLDLTTPAGALAALNSPNLDARFRGYQALVSMGEEAADVVRGQFEDAQAPAHLRARAMWVLGAIGDPLGVADAALADGDENIQTAGWGLLRQSTDPRAKEGAAARLGAVSGVLYRDDVPPAVLREAALTLRGVPADAGGAVSVPEAWAALAHAAEPGDRWMLESLGLAAEGPAGDPAARWAAVLDEYLSLWVRRTDKRGNRLLHKAWRDDPQARAVVWRSRAPRTASLLADLIRDKKTPADEVPRYLRAFDFQPDSGAKTEAVRSLAFSGKLPEDRAGLVRLEMLSRLGDAGGEDAEKAKAAVAKVLDDAKGTAEFVDLVRQFRADDRDGEEGKMEKYFSPNPGEGG